MLIACLLVPPARLLLWQGLARTLLLQTFDYILSRFQDVLDGGLIVFVVRLLLDGDVKLRCVLFETCEAHALPLCPLLQGGLGPQNPLAFEFLYIQLNAL